MILLFWKGLIAMSEMSISRNRAKKILQDYLNGEITGEDLISSLNDLEDDILIDNIINVFCEPLRDNPGVTSWQEVAKLCIQSIDEDWPTELLDQRLEAIK